MVVVEKLKSQLRDYRRHPYRLSMMCDAGAEEEAEVMAAVVERVMYRRTLTRVDAIVATAKAAAAAAKASEGVVVTAAAAAAVVTSGRPKQTRQRQQQRQWRMSKKTTL
eukprot:COSAG06_NODE_13244_length_1278_cov_4.027990_1_plen_109_part_00